MTGILKTLLKSCDWSFIPCDDYDESCDPNLDAYVCVCVCACESLCVCA